LREIGYFPGQRRDDTGQAGTAHDTHCTSAQRSMFQPAPQRVGFLLTAYIFFDINSVRCCRYSGKVGMSPHSIGALSASSRTRSPGSADTASALIMPSLWGFA